MDCTFTRSIVSVFLSVNIFFIPIFVSVKFIPVAYRQTDRERREGRRTFLDDTYVIEISVKAGEKGELYETCKHEVSKCIYHIT